MSKGVYVASRASVPKRSEMWRFLRDSGMLINASWIDESGPGETADIAELWARIESEIRRSVGLILYAEAGDFPLKGALIEAGIAIGIGIPIRIVAPKVTLEPVSFRPLGSWVRHPMVKFSATVGDAYTELTARASELAQLRKARNELAR